MTLDLSVAISLQTELAFDIPCLRVPGKSTLKLNALASSLYVLSGNPYSFLSFLALCS